MLTDRKLHEEGQSIKSAFQVNRARVAITVNHYGSSLLVLIKWICGIFDTKVTPMVIDLVDGFVLRISDSKVFVTTEEAEIEGRFEAEDLGETSVVPGFRHALSNGVILIPATDATKALFYDAVAHDGLLEQCELLAHLFKVCSSSTERLTIKNKVYSVKACTGRFPSIAITDNFISEMRGEPFPATSKA